MKEKEWEKADKEYQGKRKKVKTTAFRGCKDLPREISRACWFLINKKTPAHFNALQKLALAAHFEFPDIQMQEASVEDFEFGKFDLCMDEEDPEKMVVTYTNAKKLEKVIYAEDVRYKYQDQFGVIGYKEFLSENKDELGSDSGGFLCLEEKINSQTRVYKSKSSVGTREKMEGPALTPSEQNIVAAAFQPALHKEMTVRSACKNPEGASLAIPMLLDYYSDRKFLFAKPHERILFSETLFHHRQLTETLRFNPDLAVEILDFFAHTESYFDDLVNARHEVNSSCQASIFILEQKTRFLQWVRDQDIQGINFEKILEETRGSLEQKIQDPNYEDQKLYLSFILLDSFNCDVEPSKEKI
ncbi:MAG: hypothetical protein ACE5GN_06920, partial [Waddliaceae bacterium]